MKRSCRIYGIFPENSRKGHKNELPHNALSPWSLVNTDRGAVHMQTGHLSNWRMIHERSDTACKFCKRKIVSDFKKLERVHKF